MLQTAGRAHCQIQYSVKKNTSLNELKQSCVAELEEQKTMYCSVVGFIIKTIDCARGYMNIIMDDFVFSLFAEGRAV